MKDETMWTLTSLPEEDDEEEEQQKKEEEVNPYKNLKKPPLESQFEKQQKERVKEEKEKVCDMYTLYATLPVRVFVHCCGLNKFCSGEEAQGRGKSPRSRG